ncbi:MAG: DUF4192 family protein [Kineosporiaceae bacterium]
MDLPPVRDVRDLLALIEYELGFPPSDSLVITPTGRVSGPIVRLDLGLAALAGVDPLPAWLAGASPAATESAAARQAWGDVLGAYREHAVREVVLVGYCGAGHAVLGAAGCEDCTAAADALAWFDLDLAAEGIDSRRVLLVCAGQWADVEVRPLPGAAPVGIVGEWTPVGDLSCSPVATAMIRRGDAPVGTREQLLPDLGDPGRPTCGCRPAGASRDWARRWQRALEGRLADPRTPVGDDLRCLPALLARPALRDAVAVSALGGDAVRALAARGAGIHGELELVESTPLDDARVRAAEGILEELLAGPQRHDPVHALGLLAWWAWFSGRGARAEVIVGEALRLDPRHRLSSITAALLESLTPPPWARTASSSRRRPAQAGQRSRHAASRDVRPRLHRGRIVS